MKFLRNYYLSLLSDNRERSHINKYYESWDLMGNVAQWRKLRVKWINLSHCTDKEKANKLNKHTEKLN